MYRLINLPLLFPVLFYAHTHTTHTHTQHKYTYPYRQNTCVVVCTVWSWLANITSTSCWILWYGFPHNKDCTSLARLSQSGNRTLAHHGPLIHSQALTLTTASAISFSPVSFLSQDPIHSREQHYVVTHLWFPSMYSSFPSCFMTVMFLKIVGPFFYGMHEFVSWFLMITSIQFIHCGQEHHIRNGVFSAAPRIREHVTLLYLVTGLC